MTAALVALVLCLPVTVDAVTDGVARLETRCGWYHVAAPWAREGWTTAPWRDPAERRRVLPLAPRGDLTL